MKNSSTPAPKRAKAENPRPTEPLTKPEIDALLGACSRRSMTGVRMFAWIHLAVGAGLRVQESLDLTPRDIDLAAGTGTIKNGKGSKSRRFGFSQTVAVALERWMERRAKLAKERGWNPRTAPLFSKANGEAPSQRAVRATLGALAEKAGIEKPVRPHGLRASCATIMLGEGFILDEIQNALGHDLPHTTSAYLKRLTNADAVAAQQRFDPFKPAEPEQEPEPAQEPEDATAKLREAIDALSPEQLREALLGALGGGAAS